MVKEIAEESGEPIYLQFQWTSQVMIPALRSSLPAKLLRQKSKRVPLAIGRSFHSPFMNEAEKELGEIIKNTEFKSQSIRFIKVDGEVHTDPKEIKTI